MHSRRHLELTFDYQSDSSTNTDDHFTDFQTTPNGGGGDSLIKVGTDVRARALGISGVNFCPSIRFLGEILPGLGFALAAHPYLPLLGGRPSSNHVLHKSVQRIMTVRLFRVYCRGCLQWSRQSPKTRDLRSLLYPSYIQPHCASLNSSLYEVFDDV